jgi:hypothetical protein
MKNRIRPKTKQRYRDRIRDVIKGLSRKVLVYKQPIKQECPNCYYDKLTGRSSGKCRWTPAQAVLKQQEWAANNLPTGGSPGVAPSNCSIIPVYRYKYFVKGRCPVCLGKGYLETQRKRWIDAVVTWDPSQRGTGNQMIYTPAGTEGSTIVQLKTDPFYYDLFKNSDRIIIDGVECKMSRPPILRGLGQQSVLIITAFTTEKPKIDTEEIIKDYST